MIGHLLTRSVIVTVLGMLLAAGAADAQVEPVTVTQDDVRELTASVEELVGLLRASLEERERYRKLDLAIAYLQFRSRRIEGLERELRTTEETRASTSEGLARRREQLAELETRAGAESGRDAERTAMMTEQLRLVVGTLETQLDRLERTALDLQNDVADARRELLRFEEYVLENLDLEE
jgi:hypothetical protein